MEKACVTIYLINDADQKIPDRVVSGEVETAFGCKYGALVWWPGLAEVTPWWAWVFLFNTRDHLASPINEVQSSSAVSTSEFSLKRFTESFFFSHKIPESTSYNQAFYLNLCTLNCNSLIPNKHFTSWTGFFFLGWCLLFSPFADSCYMVWSFLSHIYLSHCLKLFISFWFKKTFI